MRNLIVLTGIILAAGLGSSTKAEQAGLVYFTPDDALGRLREDWNELQKLIDDPKSSPSDKKTRFSQLLENKYNGAIGDLPIYSCELIRKAQSDHEKGDFETESWLLFAAETLSPDSARVQLGLGRYYLGGGEFSVTRSLQHYLSAFDKLGTDCHFFQRVLGRLCVWPIGFALVFGLVLGMMILIRYFPLLVHDLGDRFPSGSLPRWMKVLLTLVLCFLPLAAGLSPWWLAAWWMILFSLYLNRAERIGALFWLLILLSFPVLVEVHCLMAGTRADPELEAALRVRNGAVLPGDLERLKKAAAQDPDDVLIQFSRAQLSIRSNEFQGVEGALELYSKCLADPRTEAAANNNLAEIYLAAQDYDGVAETLNRALAAGPDLPEVHFNLGKYYHQAMGQISKQKEEYDVAKSLSPEKFERFLALHSEAWILNRYFMPLSAPRSLIRERSFKKSSEEAALIQASWRKWFGDQPPPGWPYLASLAALALALLALSIIRRRWRLAYRCRSCGKPICLRCHQSLREPGLCEACYSVFRSQSGVDLKVKMQKRAEVQRHRDLWTRAGTALSILAPGGGHLLLGFSGLGLFFLLITSLILGYLVGGTLMWPESDSCYQGGFSGAGILMIFVYLLLTLISFLSFRASAEQWR